MSNALWSILDQTFPKIDILKQFWLRLLWIPCFFPINILFHSSNKHIAEAKQHDCTNEGREHIFFLYFFLICFNSSQQPSCLLWLLHTPVEQNLFWKFFKPTRCLLCCLLVDATEDEWESCKLQRFSCRSNHTIPIDLNYWFLSLLLGQHRLLW